MTDKEINKKIQDMVKSVKTSNKKILTFVKKKECQAASLTPSTLGMLFEIYAGVKYDAEDATTCFPERLQWRNLKKYIQILGVLMVVSGLVQMQAILEKNIKLKENIKMARYTQLNLMEQTEILLIDTVAFAKISEKKC